MFFFGHRWTRMIKMIRFRLNILNYHAFVRNESLFDFFDWGV
jgi:hypothetical protein